MLPVSRVRFHIALVWLFLSGMDLLRGLQQAAAVLLNASGEAACFDLPDDVNDDGIWDYQWCTEMLPQVRKSHHVCLFRMKI